MRRNREVGHRGAAARTRLLSFGMILGIGFLLLVSLVLSAALSALGAFLGRPRSPAGNSLAAGGQLRRQLRDRHRPLRDDLQAACRACTIDWRDVWIGAIVTSLLFSIGKLLIGLYLGKSGVASGFGAAGSLVVVLLWVYYSAQIFLLGAEFTKTYAYRHGSRIGRATPTTSDPRSATAAAATRARPRATMEDLVSMDRAKPPRRTCAGQRRPFAFASRPSASPPASLRRLDCSRGKC